MKTFFPFSLLALCLLPFLTRAQMWPAETLNANIIGAWTRSGDFDNDGDPDILVQEGDSIYWYENLRPGWVPHLIDATFYYSEVGYVDVLDLDNDGDLDVLKAPASQTGTDKLSWNENQENATVWVTHYLLELDGSLGWMQESYGDLDGDGDIDLVVPEFDFAHDPPLGNLFWLENKGNHRWSVHSLHSGNHWYSSLADMDGDGDLDVVASWEGVFWLENVLPANDWPVHTVREGSLGSHFLGVCHDMNSDGTADIISTPPSSNGGLVYYANPSWNEITIYPATQLYIGPIGDIDGDGDPDITYGAVGGLPQALGWAENKNNGTEWGLHDITPAGALQRIPTGLDDIDGDGDLDIVSLTFNVNTGLGSALWFANPLITTGVDESLAHSALPALNIWPNPFSGTANIEFELVEAGEAQLFVYSLLGQRVRTLTQEREAVGKHSLSWDGRTDSGAPAPDGAYEIRLETGKGVVTKTVVLDMK